MRSCGRSSPYTMSWIPIRSGNLTLSGGNRGSDGVPEVAWVNARQTTTLRLRPRHGIIAYSRRVQGGEPMSWRSGYAMGLGAALLGLWSATLVKADDQQLVDDY